MEAADRAISILTTVLVRIAGLALIALVAITVVNMTLRVGGRALVGTFEIVGWMTAVSNGLALAFTQRKKGHVTINIVFDRLPDRIQVGVGLVVILLCSGLFALAAWRLFGHANDLRAVGTLSDALRVPFHPFVTVFAFGIAVLALVFAYEALAMLKAARESKRTST